MARLSDVRTVYVPSDLLEETARLLAEAGRHGLEAIVLWAGTIRPVDAFDVELILRPSQTAYSGAEGLLAQVNSDELFRINCLLSEKSLRLIAQLHTHPGDAYHSETDDDFALVSAAGSISIVVPHFARNGIDLAQCAIYRLNAENEWLPVDVAARTNLICVD